MISEKPGSILTGLLLEYLTAFTLENESIFFSYNSHAGEVAGKN